MLIIKLLLFPLLVLCTSCSKDNKLSNKQRLILITEQYAKITISINCPEITASKLKEITTSSPHSVTLIDVRSSKERATSQLPLAISSDTFLKNPNKYSHTKIIAYCTIGYRSGKFAEKYQQYQISNLTGGVLMWSHIKGKFSHNQKHTQRVHIYSQSWNYLHSDYEAVSK